MDNAFQELDYSDISAKNLNKKNRSIDNKDYISKVNIKYNLYL